MSATSESIKAALFADGADVYAILDGASVKGLLQRLADDEAPHACLFEGDLTPDMAEVAPYLVALDAAAPITDWIVESGWSKHWGMFLQSAAGLIDLRTHFRALTRVYDPSMKPMYFRYYDPRVLRTYLGSCNAEELTKFFGPARALYAEDATGDALVRFELKDGKLETKPIGLKKGGALAADERR